MQYFEKNRPLETIVPALRNVAISPKAFFAELPPAAFYSNAIFFVSILVFVASFIGVPFYSMTMLFLLPVSWGLTLIGLKFWAAYLSWAVRFFAKTKLSAANAFQISAYASAPLIFSAVPVIGSLAGFWNLYLLWVALTQRCQVKAGMAALIIAIPAVVFVTSLGVLVALLVQMFPQLGLA
ncbi:MAG: YIP1 family protein [Mariprofundus sp.]